MTYDFTTIMDRRGQDAVAVDGLTDTPTGMAPTRPAEGFDAHSHVGRRHELPRGSHRDRGA